jgi:hypothetical protein
MFHPGLSAFKAFNRYAPFNPDSAVAADAMSEEQTFRSEVNGSLPLSGHRSSVVQDEM